LKGGGVSGEGWRNGREWGKRGGEGGKGGRGGDGKGKGMGGGVSVLVCGCWVGWDDIEGGLLVR